MTAPTIPQLYAPDGAPIDGPRTTAAELAATLAAYNACGSLTAPAAGPCGCPTRDINDVSADWRAAAAYEADRYAEALAGGRAMTAYLACDAVMRADGRRCANPADHGHITESEARALDGDR